MRVRNVMGAWLVSVVLALGLSACGGGTQAPSQTPAPAPAPAQGQVHGNLVQVMRGILFPNSNIIFAVQTLDPKTVKPEADPASAVNPLASTYGGWQAVESSGIALAEAANLLTIPGRLCSNGKPVPVDNADWAMFVQGLRDAGMAAYTAAQAKNQEAFLDVSDKMTAACGNCHDVYREKTEAQGGLAARCTK